MDLPAAWKQIRARVEAAMVKYATELGHPLCPWGFDAVELPAVLNYIDDVLKFNPNPEESV